VLIVVFSLLKKTGVTITNRYLNLIKPLIPSWKFYDDFEETSLLFYQIKTAPEKEFTEWAPLYQTPRVVPSMLVVNHQGNLILAAQSHIQQLIHDINEHYSTEPFQETLTYKVTKNLVSFALLKKYSPPFHYRFKLATISDKHLIKEDILLSPDYEEGV
jgi:hypothetical protein